VLTGALLRYLAADAIRSGRWAAPTLCFVGGTLAFDAGGGTALSCYGFSASMLLPVGLWLAVAVGNSEDPVQADITVVTAGGPVRVRLATLALAYLFCLALAVVGLAWPLSNHRMTPGAIPIGVLEHLLLALAGVAFGAPLTRPVVDRLAWVVMAGVGVTLVELLVPGAPPLRRLLALLNAQSVDPRTVAGPLAVTAAETVVLAVVLVTAAHRLARRRR
jgi:hypothetical protein